MERCKFTSAAPGPTVSDVKFVSQNREKGYKKGLATMEERCEPLAAYEAKLLASQQAFQRRCLAELKSITG